MKPAARKAILISAALLAVPFAGSLGAQTIQCQGDYKHHLQGVCRDGQGHLYWSFTTDLVKTNGRGQVVKRIEVPNHHGDLCFRNNKIYVAVNLGRFNDPQGKADSWVYVYRPGDLSLIAKHEVQQVFHGAGGITSTKDRFFVVGGLPAGVQENYVYEYDDKFHFVRKHIIKSGYTRLGIQTAEFDGRNFWFGCYGNQLLKTDASFGLVGSYKFDCGYGIVAVEKRRLMAARGPRTKAGRCLGQLVTVEPDSRRGLWVRKPITRLLFGSCIKQNQPAPLLDTIVAQRPDLFVFLGDNIYADTTDMNVMKKKYAKLKALSGFGKLLELCPVLATWDDHDYGVNDGGAEYPMRSASEKIFLDFWGDPADSPRRQRPGIYEARIMGPEGKRVQVILLDTRYFRGKLRRGAKRTGGPYYPNPDKAVPMLGETQWKWLRQQLQKPAELRVIASSIQLIAESSGQETWSNLPHERNRFFQLLKDTKASGVVVISGDRHWSELSVIDNVSGYPLYDLTSSSLNQPHPRGTPTANRFRADKRTWHHQNFGAIRIDWSHSDPKVSLQILDDQAKVRIEKKLRLSELK